MATPRGTEGVRTEADCPWVCRSPRCSRTRRSALQRPVRAVPPQSGLSCQSQGACGFIHQQHAWIAHDRLGKAVHLSLPAPQRLHCQIGDAQAVQHRYRLRICPRAKVAAARAQGRDHAFQHDQRRLRRQGLRHYPLPGGGSKAAIVQKTGSRPCSRQSATWMRQTRSPSSSLSPRDWFTA